jgi:hypothetical protein
VLSTWVGTDDNPVDFGATSGTYWSPSNPGNLVKTEENTYDIEGNLTQQTLFSGEASRGSSPLPMPRRKGTLMSRGAKRVSNAPHAQTQLDSGKTLPARFTS